MGVLLNVVFGQDPNACLPPDQALKAAARPNLVPAANPPECDLLAGGRFPDGLPLPGTPEFCDALGAITDALQQVDDTLFSWVNNLEAIKRVTNKIQLDHIDTNLFGWVNNLIDIWNKVVDSATNAVLVQIDAAAYITRQAIKLQDCILSKYNPKALRGLWILQQLVAMLERVRAGIDPGVWLTLDISFTFDLPRRWIEMVQHYLAPMEMPSPEAATRAWLLDRIDITQRDCIWRVHGHNPDTFEPFALVDREQLEWREAVQYVRRLGLGQQAESDALRARGFVEPSDERMAQEMYWELPNIADHLHWLTRNVDDVAYVQQYGLLDGFDNDAGIRELPQFAAYTTVVDPGKRNFWQTFGRDLTALGMRKEYAAYHYAAHWIMPSPEQLKEFVYRSDEIEAATGTPFTLADMRRILAEQDYSPTSVRWFTATAFNVPAISYVKEWYRQGLINKEQLATYHKRLGFSQQDADKFADIDDIQKRRMRASSAHTWTTRAATDAWVAKEIDDGQHGDIYRGLGYTDAEASTARDVAGKLQDAQVWRQSLSQARRALPAALNNALQVGIITPQQMSANLVAAGWQKNLADSYATVQGTLSSVNRIKQGITFLRRRVLDGTIQLPQAIQELQRLGLTPKAIADYAAVWQLLMTPRRKQRSASQIVNDVAMGHMQRPEALVRLRNLGYADPDAQLFMADAQARLGKLNAARQKANAANLKARQKLLAATAKAAAKEKSMAVKAMIKDMPVSKLEKWLKLGLISRANFRERMTLYDYSPAEIDLRIAEQCGAKRAACVDQSPAALPDQGQRGGGGPAQ